MSARRLRRLIFLPLALLAAPLYRHFHPTHTWLEGKVRDTVNQQIAPLKVTSVHCTVNGSLADCDLSTSDGHRYTIHVTKSGNTWTAQRAELVG